MGGAAAMFWLVVVTQSVNCSTILNCTDCNSKSSCTWCSYSPGIARCTDTCLLDQEYISKVFEVDGLPLSEQNQVTLQTISLQLKVDEPLNVTFLVKAVDEFPLDLYILMDLSYSFQVILQRVKSLAPHILLNLQNLSQLSQVGFGAFVDKPVLPYTSTRQASGLLNGFKPSFSYEHNYCGSHQLIKIIQLFD